MLCRSKKICGRAKRCKLKEVDTEGERPVIQWKEDRQVQGDRRRKYGIGKRKTKEKYALV